MGFMHGYMKYTQPLFIQGIMPIKSLYDSKVRGPSAPSVALAPEADLSRTVSPALFSTDPEDSPARPAGDGRLEAAVRGGAGHVPAAGGEGRGPRDGSDGQGREEEGEVDARLFCWSTGRGVVLEGGGR